MPAATPRPGSLKQTRDGERASPNQLYPRRPARRPTITLCGGFPGDHAGTHDQAKLPHQPQLVEGRPALGDLPIGDPEDHDPLQRYAVAGRGKPVIAAEVRSAPYVADHHAIPLGDDILDRRMEVR